MSVMRVMCVVGCLVACSAATDPASLPLWTQWCDSSARCKEDGDAGGWCDIDTWKCRCSAGYGPLLVEGEWRWFGCYPEVRQARVSLAFARGSCEANGGLAADVPAGVVAAVEAAAGSTATSFSYACGVVTFVMTLDVPAANVEKLAAADLQAEVVRLMSTELQAVLGAAVAVQSAVSPSTLPAAPAPWGWTHTPAHAPVPETPAPTDEPLACTTVDNAVLAFVVTLGDMQHCTATKCKTGYVLDQRNDTNGFDCVASTTEAPCVVSGDCTWDALKPRCESGTCATSPPPPSKTTKEVRRPTSYVSDFCSTNADCQLTGDTKAECVVRAVQGNYCKCSTGYEISSPACPVCVRAGAVAVPLQFAIDYPAANCSDYPSVADAVTLLLRDSLGNVTLLQAVCGSVSLVGEANVPRDSAESIGAGITNLRVTVSDGATGDVVDNLGEPTRAVVSNGVTCPAPAATKTVLDLHARCHALECEVGFSSLAIDGVYVCVAERSGDDDDLTDAEKGWIGVGVVLTLLLVVILVAVACALKNRPSTHPKEHNEPTADA